MTSAHPDASTDAPAEGTAVRLHRCTTRWPIAVRIAWWLFLLPLALALFSGGRLHGWPRRLGLSTATVLAAFFAIGMFAEPVPTEPAPAQFAAATGNAAKAATSKTARTEETAEQKAAAEQAAAEQAAADEAAAEAAAQKAAADKAAADKAAADKAAAEAAAQKAAADRAAADKAAAEQKAAADKAAAQQAAPAPARAGAKEYANCTELRKDYRGGVARPGAVNEGGATKYDPHYDNALYEANTKSDRDKDGIACEA